MSTKSETTEKEGIGVGSEVKIKPNQKNSYRKK